MRTRYVTLPELSVEGFQVSVTLFAVVAVTCRLVGVVGGVRSGAARAGVVPKSDTSTTRIAATLAARQYDMLRIMLYLQSPHKKLHNRRAAVYTELYGLNASLDWLSSILRKGRNQRRGGAKIPLYECLSANEERQAKADKSITF